MTEFQEEIAAMRQTKLKVGIVNFLKRSEHGFKYMSHIRAAFPWPTDVEFATCIDTLIDNNFVTQTVGSGHGARLTLKDSQGVSNGK